MSPVRRFNVAVATLLIAGLCLAASPPPDRDLRVAGRIAEAFNEPDPAARRALLDAAFGTDRDNGRITTVLGMLARKHGQVTVDEVVDSGPTWARVVLAGGTEADSLTLEIEFEEPESDAIASLGFRPGRPAPASEMRVDTAERAAIVVAIADLVRAEYAIASERDRIADAIEAWDAELFADATSASRFASRVTAELRRIQDDKHFAVLDPARARPWLESPEEGEGHAHGGGHAMPDHGLARSERLEGNVAYLEVTGFDDAEPAMEKLDRIMADLAGAEALVIDLRGCRGGGPGMVVALSSYLFPEPTHLATSISPWSDGPLERWTTAPPIPDFTSVPVSVLTDGMTASAAESFTFGLRRNGRITTFGEVTAGAGHLADMRALPAGFGFQVPVGRTYDPDTDQGWEGTGITPDVEVPTDRALDAALGALGPDGFSSP